MKLLTVFTPTFNRGYCLHKCYESLLNQTNKDFIWLIIDDGSTDHTFELVNGWIEENKVEIRYIKQENQGMHGAHNTAYENINTELNVCIDSDDYMPEQAVEKIISFWKAHGSNKVSGIIGLDANQNGTIIGTRMPEQIKTSTLFGLYHSYKVKGDKKLVYRTELIKKHPYPLFKGEKYVGLAYKYFLLDQEYEMLIMNEVLCIVEYLHDGSSRNMLMQYRKNPQGFAFYRTELMNLKIANSWFKGRQAVHYVASSLLARNKFYIRETPNKMLTLLGTPFGILLYFLIIFKTNRIIQAQLTEN